MPVGDVTLKEENPPIVIGVAKYRGVGIGKKVMAAIIERAKALNIPKLYGSTVYDYSALKSCMNLWAFRWFASAAMS